MPADGGMHSKSVHSVEDESAGHRKPSVSESRLGQQGRDRPSADVVDARVDHAVAYDLGQQRGIEFGAVKLPQHHREVGTRRIPAGFEIGAEFNLWRAVRPADGNLPPAAGWLCFAARGKLRQQRL